MRFCYTGRVHLTLLKKRNRVFYQTVGALTFLLVVIVFFLHEFLLIGVILSLAFVVYVISTIPPFEVEHKVTRLGYENSGRLFRWIELYAFWFDEKWGQKMLVFQTRLPFPGQVSAILAGTSEQKSKDIIGRYLLYLEKPHKSFIDNLTDWIGKKIPLETTS